MSLFPPAACPRLIVKIGSALLVDPDGAVRRDWLTGIAADIAARAEAGQQVAVVSSGAIALGARRLGLAKGGRASLEDAQAAAATGQIALSQVWAEVLGAEGLTAAQMLVTLDDLEHRRRYLNAAATLDRLLSLGVVPIINENDSVATEEIRFGDNDRLAARVAQAAGADGVILLSDIDGLYDRNPAQDGAVHIARIERIDAAIDAMARCAPAALAMRAAAIFDTMPPDPMPEAEPVSAIASMAASIRSMRAIWTAPSCAGLRSYSPSMSDSRITPSAPAACATRAASRSLSPKRISSVATLSFSLMIGTTPRLSRRSSVAAALR